MLTIKKFRCDEILVFIAGTLLVFAFAPINFYPLAVACPALLLLIWLQSSAKQAFWRGLIFGLGLFGVGASWIYISIHNFGNANLLLAGFITGLFIIALSLFIAIQGYVFVRLFPDNTTAKICLGFPCTWMLFEWLRSWLFTGFPWLFLGASQTASALRGYAPIAGEFGLSFLVSLTSALIILLLFNRKNILTSLCCAAAILIIWITGFFIAPIQWTSAIGKPIDVALIQGNIPQQLKWTPEFLIATLKRYSQLTQQNWDKQLIIWPETAVPLLLKDAMPFIEKLDHDAKQHHTAVITGIPIQESFNYFNGAIAVGTGNGIYYKRHLVPFGEYTPLVDWFGKLLDVLNIPMSDFREGPYQQPQITTPQANIALFICYEIAYPALALSELPKANILATISNDAWFGRSFASAQHLQIGQIRAQETGRYHLFSSNSGLTAIINPHGKILAIAPPFETAVLTGNIYAMTGATPLVRIGLNGILLITGGLLLIAWLWDFCKRKKSDQFIKSA